MQHPSTFKRSFITRCAIGAALVLLGDCPASRRLLAHARSWYQLQLEQVYVDEQVTIESFVDRARVSLRTRVAMALIYIAAVQPRLVMCGVISAVLWPSYFLLVLMMYLKHLVLR
jgi:hypothetical protein